MEPGERQELHQTKASAVVSAGEIIAGRYKVISLLGHGGMGSVYKVEQIFLKKEYALKMLNSVGLSDVVLRRFQKEAQAASKLDHPSLVKAHEFGLIDGSQPFFVMDLAEGETLSGHLKRHGMLSQAETIRLMIPICFGLAYAHQHGVIHRDLKPGNIVLTRGESGSTGGTAKVVDFGIAKLDEGLTGEALTKTGEIFGTPLYMSPEQCMGNKVDHRTDIYSLGCVIFECLTGAPPFSGDSALAIMMRHQSDEPQTLKEASLGNQYPPELEKAVARLLAKNPDDRYQSMLAVANELFLIQSGNLLEQPLVAEAKPDSTVTRKLTFHDAIALSIAALGFMCLGSVVTLFTMGHFSRNATRPMVTDLDLAVRQVYIHDLPRVRGEYFSKIEETGHRRMRVFHFPTKFSLGELSWLENNVRHRVLAKGRQAVPYGINVNLKLAWQVCHEHPEWLSSFRPDDLFYLGMDDSDIRGVIYDDSIFDTTLSHAGHLTGLKCIDLDQLPVTDEGVEHLARLPDLSWIHVGGTKVTMDWILNYKRLPKLRCLDVSGIAGADRLIKKLLSGCSLEELGVRDCNLKSDDLMRIARFKELQYLYLSGNDRLVADDLRPLQSLPALLLLELRQIALPPASIEVLSGFKQLRFLTINADRFTPEDVTRLKSQLPGCQITTMRTRKGRHSRRKDVRWFSERTGPDQYDDSDASENP